MVSRHPGVIVILALVPHSGCGGDAQSYDLDGGDLVTLGQAYSEQRGCPTCHQSSNAADGVLSGQSVPRPRTMAFGGNLTPDVKTGLGAWADIEIVRAMRYGIDNQELPLCPTMTHYDGSDPSQPFMTDLEARAIVTYLRSLRAVARPNSPQSICPPIKLPPMDMSQTDAAAPPDDLAIPSDLAPPIDLLPTLDTGGAPADGGTPADGAEHD